MSRLTRDWTRTSTPSHGESARNERAPGTPKRPPPFSLRLNADERRQLEEDAGRHSMSSYIKSCLFDPDRPVKPVRGLTPVKDQEALAQVLALLGSSRLSEHLAELADQARHGVLPLDGETETGLRRACEDIQVMRRFLLAALGIREQDSQKNVCESCASAFTRAVADAREIPEREPEP